MKWFRSHAFGSHAGEWFALGVMIVFAFSFIHCLIKSCLLAADTRTRHRRTGKRVLANT